MSAGSALQAAAKAVLDARADLEVTVFDFPPIRAARPFAVVDEPLLADWSTKDIAGREGRLSVTLHDQGERPARLRALIGEVEAAIEAMPRVLGEGWRVASLVFVRSRVVREGDRYWAAMSEWRVRMLREG